jgi:hypothetical protein
MARDSEPTIPNEAPKPRANVATVLQMLHEERMAFAQRRSGGGYGLDLKRGNSSTNMGVVAIDLHGEQREDQTAEEFVVEHAKLFKDLCAIFPMPDGKVRAT